MTTYRIVYEVVVEADDEAEALDEAMLLINGEYPEPSIIEVLELEH